MGFMQYEIPDYFRPEAKKVAAKRILDAKAGGYFDDERFRRIIQDIAESEWERDRIEWKAWMRKMKNLFDLKFHQLDWHH